MIKDKLEEFIELAKNLSVLVVGETIIDEFIDVSYEGQSMKSICSVLKLEGGHLIQQGGSSAIANHLKDFVKSITVITNTANEIVKTRYIDIHDKKKHIEINKFDKFNTHPFNINTADYDIVIVADFGHGFCDNLIINDGFHLMCQTNSNNFGFNRISKWKKYTKHSTCIDLREASLQINKRISNPTQENILEIYNYEINTQDLFVTSGKSGAFYTNGLNVINRQSFKSEVVDTIGAGDTFFAFSCISSHFRNKIDDLLIIPSLAASLSTTWLCNERSVTKNSLIEYANRFI